MTSFLASKEMQHFAKSLERNSNYHILIGEFTYLMSYLDQVILEYFAQLFPSPYKSDLMLLSVEDGFRSQMLLNASYKIYERRNADSSKKRKFKSLIDRFQKITNQRNSVLHSTWAADPEGGYLIKKLVLERHKKYNELDLQELNKDCNKWLEDFINFTKLIPTHRIVNELDTIALYLDRIGRLIIHFSQVEMTIRAQVASFLEIVDSEAFILIGKHYLLELLKYLSITGDLKEKITKLNMHRNEIVHNCFLMQKSIEDLDSIINSVTIQEIFNN
jgi:uncharacterized protein YutE (UPF0331/DUF86 family)